MVDRKFNDNTVFVTDWYRLVNLTITVRMVVVKCSSPVGVHSEIP